MRVSTKMHHKSVLHLLKYRFAVYYTDAVQICGKFWDTQYIKCSLLGGPQDFNNKESCVKFDSKSDFQWTDGSCSLKRPFLCEIQGKTWAIFHEPVWD